MKAELTGRLIEYSACKRVAAALGSRARDMYTAVRKPMTLKSPAEYTRPQDPDRLVQAWYNLMGRSLRRRKPSQERFEPLVAAPFVSVGSRVAHLLRGLLRGTLHRMSQPVQPAGKPQHQCGNLSGFIGTDSCRACSAGRIGA